MPMPYAGVPRITEHCTWHFIHFIPFQHNSLLLRYRYLPQANRECFPGHFPVSMTSLRQKSHGYTITWEALEGIAPEIYLDTPSRYRIGVDPEGVLTYPFAEPEEQVSGLTNQYIPSSASGEHVTLVASTYGKGAMRTVRNANNVVAH